MAFSLNEFRAKINKSGLAKSNLFETFITAPTGVSGTQDSRFWCRSVSIPGIEIGTNEVKPHGYGPSVKRPAEVSMEPITCVFIVNGTFDIQKMLHEWMQLIVNYDNRSYVSSYQGIDAYEFGYLRDYAGSLAVKVYSGNNTENFYEYRFGNVYPISVGNVEVAWDNDAEIMVLTATFAYDIINNTSVK